MKHLRSGRLTPTLIGAALVVFLAGGCSSDRSDLQQWMEGVRAEAKPVPRRVNEPRVFEPYRYQEAGRIDPFSATKIASSDFDGKGRNNDLAPDQERLREPLEAWPLDSIRMVGYLSNPQGSYALLQTEQNVYQASVGNYVGRNYGKVMRISESGIELRELVQDAAGDWMERETTLRIDERNLDENNAR